MDNYFIVLGGSTDQLYIIKNIKELKYKTIIFDKNKNSPAFKISDLSFAIDFKKYKNVITKLHQLKKNKDINYQGIITMGCDVPYIITKIAKEFNLQSNSIKSAKISEDKNLMKKLFLKTKIRTSKYAIIRNPIQALNFWKKNNATHVVIKPTDNSGSKGVQLLHSYKQIEAAIKNAKKNTKKKHLIIEEFLEGPQLSTESIIYKGKVFTPGLSHRHYEQVEFFLPQIMENGGTVSLKYKSYIIKINKIIKKIADELKFESGVIKGDFVINKKHLNIIEFTTRLSGGDFSESVAPLSNGINYVKEAVKIAANKSITINNLKPKFSRITANRYFFLPPGILSQIKGLSEVKKIKELKKIEFYYKINSKISKIDSHGKRVGVFIVVTKDKKKLNKIISKIYNKVFFRVNNDWTKGRPDDLKDIYKVNPNLKSINMFK